MEISDMSINFMPEINCGKHSELFPKTIFCVIAGSTGSGKPNLIINLLTSKNALDYSDVYIYSSTLHQRGYQYLKEIYGKLENYFKNIYKKSIKIAYFLNADEEIQDPSKLDTNTNHIMIFDDVMLKDQAQIKEYFCIGRHNNINVFYLCQSLNKIAKHCIKDNANIFIFVKQNDKTLKYFYESHISGDMDLKEFKSFCDEA